MRISVLSSVILLFFVGISEEVELVTRKEWGARATKSASFMTKIPVYAFVHHTFIPAKCTSKKDCIKAMQTMQNMHMDSNGWDDIGYSFAIGSDGRVYEGRGWNRVGAHTKGYNSVGLGFVVIGDYRFETPDPQAQRNLKEWISYGVSIGKLIQNYTLRGHRDMKSSTECPGQALYDLIQTWPHY